MDKKFRLDDRDMEILKILVDEGPQNKNQLYIRTSPVCKRTGRTRVMGTFGWKKLMKLTSAGLISEFSHNPAVKDPTDNFEVYRLRHRVRYTYTITSFGIWVLSVHEGEVDVKEITAKDLDDRLVDPPKIIMPKKSWAVDPSKVTEVPIIAQVSRNWRKALRYP